MKKSFTYKGLEKFTEKTELKHIKFKVIFVNYFIIVIAFFMYIFLNTLQYSNTEIFGVMFLFFITISINIVLSTYKHNEHSYMTFSMYFTTIMLFVICVDLVLMFEDPSMLMALLIVYAITSIYQDKKVTILSNLFFFFFGVGLVIRFSDFFVINDENSIPMVFLLLCIIMPLLALSSSMIVKRKNFFYNKLTEVNESEYRCLNLVNELRNDKIINKSSYLDYMVSLRSFAMEMEDSDTYHIYLDIMEDLNKNKHYFELLEKYPLFSRKDFESISNLLINKETPIKMTCLKSELGADRIKVKHFKTDTQFRTFNHLKQSLDVKIVTFVVFYTMLRLDKQYLGAMTDEDIYKMLNDTDFCFIIDNKILQSYVSNNDVFDSIIRDYFGDDNK